MKTMEMQKFNTLGLVPAQSTALERTGNQLTDLLTSQTGLVLCSCLVAAVVLQLVGGSSKKGKIATSFWGGFREKAIAAKKAKKQMSKVTRNNVALYVGMPMDVRERLEQSWRKHKLLKGSAPPTWQRQINRVLRPSPTLYIPDAQRGIAAIGAAGSGKTFSVIDPLIRSALDQGFPMCLYDFKAFAQTSRAAAYAIKRGYQVRVFAPGFEESDVCNPLDLLADEEDALMARQMSEVLGRNFDKGGGDSGDKFFTDAGDQLVEAIFLLTKAIKTLTGTDEYCDIMMAQAILSLENLPARIRGAQSKLNPWTTRAFSQLLSVADSERTVASIVATASKVFQRFLKRDLVGSFCGNTTLPLDLDGKQLIIFGLDRNKRDVVAPLLATILHMIVMRNVSRTIPRKDPLVVALDELPTLYLPQLVNWLNENREDGFVGILGYQNIVQLEKAYGRELSRAILGGCATKFIFNPQDPDSSKLFADYLGEMEVQFKSQSRSTGKGGGSKSFNEQHQKRHLLEPAQFSKMQTGRCVLINPAYTRGNEGYVPLFLRVPVPQADIDEMNWSVDKWDLIRRRLRAGKKQLSNEVRRQQLDERLALAEKLFPIPEDPVKAGPLTPSPEELNKIF